jgi:hypothetical protein
MAELATGRSNGKKERVEAGTKLECPGYWCTKIEGIDLDRKEWKEEDEMNEQKRDNINKRNGKIVSRRWVA